MLHKIHENTSMKSKMQGKNMFYKELWETMFPWWPEWQVSLSMSFIRWPHKGSHLTNQVSGFTTTLWMDNWPQELFHEKNVGRTKSHEKYFHISCVYKHVIWWNRTWSILIGSGNGLVPDDTKPLPEPILTSHWWGSVAFTWEQFHWPSFYHVYTV